MTICLPHVSHRIYPTLSVYHLLDQKIQVQYHLLCIKYSKIYAQALSEYMQEDFNEVNNIGVQTYLKNCEIPLCEWLDKNYHIQTLYKVDGIVLESLYL